jgi:hypothetical protein
MIESREETEENENLKRKRRRKNCGAEEVEGRTLELVVVVVC